MKSKKVLKMLKTKIDLMPEGCNYVLRTSDIEAINKALKLTCTCCVGTGVREDMDSNKVACLACNGSGVSERIVLPKVDINKVKMLNEGT